jgi:RNA polymerase sigma-70 factor, ECF subfamily
VILNGSIHAMPPSDPQQHQTFLPLYVEHEPSLRGFVRSLVPTLDDVQDVMQEVATALWKRFHTLSAPGDFRRWAFGVARLEALEFLRKKRRDRHVFGDELFDKLAAEAEGAADEFVEERKALDVCLQKLPDDQRTLVEAAYAPGVRMDELAARLGRTAMAVYKSLHRIRIALIGCTKKHLSLPQGQA